MRKILESLKGQLNQIKNFEIEVSDSIITHCYQIKAETFRVAKYRNRTDLDSFADYFQSI